MTFSATTKAQIHPDDSIAILSLRDQLGLTNVISSGSNTVSSWVPTYIDTIFDQGSNSYRITKIDFGGLTPTATTSSVLPASIFDGNRLNFVEYLYLDSIGIDSISGFLRPNNTGTPPAVREINISFNSFPSGNNAFFSFLLENMDNVERLDARRVFQPNSSNFSNYALPTSPQIKHIDIRNNSLAGVLNIEDLLTNKFTNLEFLYAGYNRFTNLQVPANQVTGSNFKKLQIDGLFLQDFKPIEVLLNTVQSIQWLYASNTMDTANIRDTIEFKLNALLPSLRVLNISNNRLRGPLPIDLFEKLPNVEVLYLFNNSMSGNFPTPPSRAGAPFNSRAYSGLSKLKELDISNNSLKGPLPLDWLFLRQLRNLQNQNTPMPIESFYASRNYFKTIQPELKNTTSNILLTSNALSSRFAALKELEVENNRLDFKDLFRLKRLLRLKHNTNSTHYIPQNGLDSTDFTYAPQKSLGIGGIRRRSRDGRIIFTAGIGVVAAETNTTTYIANQYTWERLDTTNLAGGTATNPVIQTIGTTQQIGGSNTPNLAANNISGDPSYLLGVDTMADNIHRLGIQNLDSTTHNNWLYRAKIENDSFPSLSLYTKPKKIIVANCVDSSGAPIHCQTMIVQFHPDTLALYSPSEQDSLKAAIRAELGAEPIDECMCGDIELWGISDTAKTILESNGKGTKQAASQASGKPQLLSADPNYSLLSATSNSLPDSVPLPSGSGNSSAKTLVAIIDSGVDYDYRALRPYLSEGAATSNRCLPNAVFGYNFYADNNNATDDHGHGTSIAGIVAGISQQNALPDTGNLKTDLGILPLKYTDKEGAGSLFHAACAFRYAADYERSTTTGQTAKVRVINASWGYYGDPCIVLENTLKYVGEDCGILVVTSAGNGGIPVQGSLANRHWPSNSIWDTTGTLTTDNILAVAGLNLTQDALHAISNYGDKHIDIAAPWYESTPLAGSQNGFVAVEGTSFATPQVTRAAALLFDKYPDATYFAVKYALMHGVDTLQHLDSNKIVSKGKLNYHKAEAILGNILNRTLCADTGFVLTTTPIATIKEALNIYPNPTQHHITIDLDYTWNNSIQFSLFSIQGQKLLQKTIPIGTTQTTISTKDLAAGVYFIRLETNGQYYSQKIIKQ